MGAPKDPKKRELWKKRLSIALSGENGPNWGKKFSQEHKQKLSESRKGRIPWNKGKVGVYSENILKKMSEAQMGHPVSLETRKKMSQSRKGLFVGNKSPMFGKHLSIETKKKLSKALKGRKISKEHRHKISEAMMGHIVSKANREKFRERTKKQCLDGKHPMLGKHHSKETKEKISIANKGKHSQTGRHHTEETKRKISRANLGRIPWHKGKTGVYSKETLEKIGKAHKGKIISAELKERWSKMRQGVNNPNWKGGVTLLAHRIRNNFKYRQWRSDVFYRDDFTCQKCGDFRGGNLRAHHSKPTSQILFENDIKTFEQAMNCEQLWDTNNGITLCNRCHEQEHKRSRTLEKIENLLDNRHTTRSDQIISNFTGIAKITKII